MSRYCVQCYGQGILFAFKKADVRGNEEPYECVFRCECSWSSGDPRPYPRWNSNYAKLYEIDRSKGPQEPRFPPVEAKPIPVVEEAYKPNVAPLVAPMAGVLEEPGADFFDAPYTEELF